MKKLCSVPGLGLILVVGCSPFSLDSVMLAPDQSVPEVYGVWWADVSACSGLVGNLDRVEWVFVQGDQPNDRFRCEKYGVCHGLWIEPHTIYISVLGRPNETIVKHEILHDLTQSGSHRHFGFESCVPSITVEGEP